MSAGLISARPFVSGRVRNNAPLEPIRQPLDATLDPADYEGVQVYGADGQIYYSDGQTWSVPAQDVTITRPRALPPTNALEQRQLRLTPFFSPSGLLQTGLLVQVARSETGFDAPLFERTILDNLASSYTTRFPEDGLVPGDVFWWRGLYTGTEGQRSAFSVPFQQTYPDFIQIPEPITRNGITSGVVQITPFDSAFGFLYAETQVEFYDPADPATPLLSVTEITGGTITIPTSLIEGQEYLWRARYGGREVIAGPITYTDWTDLQSVFNGAAAMVLVYDPNLAVSREISLGLNLYAGGADLFATIDWGDGAVEEVTTAGRYAHAYAPEMTDVVTVTLNGQIGSFGDLDRSQPGLIRVEAIGTKMALRSLRGAFRRAQNLTVINGALPSDVTDISYLFQGTPFAPGLYAAVEGFETGNVTNMAWMFSDGCDFNGDLSGWIVSNVTTFAAMFRENLVFNHPGIQGWDTGSATNMSEMFAGPSAGTPFNQDLSGWNVAKVTTFAGMFRNTAFNQDLSDWNTGAATTMRQMFEGCAAFSFDLSQWDVAQVSDFGNMLARTNYPGDVSGWDTGNMINGEGLFRGTETAITGLETWNTSRLRNARAMFAFTISASGIANWETSQLENMASMFEDIESAPPVETWTVSNVATLSRTFQKALSVPDLSLWDTRSCVNFERMLGEVRSSIRDLDLSQWNVSAGIDFEAMFSSTYEAGGAGWTLNPNLVDLDLRWTLPVGAYSDTLIRFANQVATNGAPQNVTFTNSNCLYDATPRDPGGAFPTAAEARAYLIAQGWTITGDSPA
ncbi:BspA family leucine-rich repeat surface protein [Thalassococcus sp. S3]|uniref:BspA family leucine-rich repeat surface protein n=1 Tax=Thalassococcus sp. S3 TaxID=2017482 RepID=UPI0010247059|nr:BspA family leucine-rich repeat surface protein [Thalassococcus sp. S3]QBF32135.1 hypothetical protein CFI11_13030 [Thalassococcus sp. S3]